MFGCTASFTLVLGIQISRRKEKRSRRTTGPDACRDRGSISAPSQMTTNQNMMPWSACVPSMDTHDWLGPRRPSVYSYPRSLYPARRDPIISLRASSVLFVFDEAAGS